MSICTTATSEQKSKKLNNNAVCEKTALTSEDVRHLTPPLECSIGGGKKRVKKTRGSGLRSDLIG